MHKISKATKITYIEQIFAQPKSPGPSSYKPIIKDLKDKNLFSKDH